MDWAVTARTTVPHVREVDADRELTTWLLVDASPSMEFGTAELDKRELAVAAVAAVGFLTAGTGNRLGAQVLTRRRGAPLPGPQRAYPLLALLRALLHAPRADRRAADQPRRPARDLAAALDRRCTAVATRRGLVVVVSDFLDGLPDDPGRPGRPGSRRCAGWPPGTRCSRSR